MVGTKSMRMALPYRGLKEDREEIVEYKQPASPGGAVPSNGRSNGR